MEGGLSPKIATAVADREVLEYIQRNVNVYEEGYKEAVAKHESNCMELIGALESVVNWAFPELQYSRNFQAVIAAVGQKNPGRAADLQAGVRLFEQAAEYGLQARQRNEHEKAERFQTWARNQDNIFRSQNPEFFSPQQQKEVAHEAFEYLESKGISKEEAVMLHEFQRALPKCSRAVRVARCHEIPTHDENQGRAPRQEVRRASPGP